MSGPAAYWSDEHQCWYVPVSPELMKADTTAIEPCHVELRDGQLWITDLAPSASRKHCATCDGEEQILDAVSPYASDHAYPIYVPCPDCSASRKERNDG